jgi:beta-glucanase (GH16 family)
LCDAPQTFREEFSGSQLNAAIWEQCKAYLKDCAVEDANGSIEWWKPGNATVANGALQMAFTRETNTVCIDCSFRDIRYVTRDYAGVFIQTSQSFTTTSGYIEARMKLPAASGLWPAFWLLPELSPQGNIVWPPEIDVVEQFTKDPLETFHTLHYPSPERNRQDGNTIRYPNNVADDYHVYAVNWTPELIIWYVDGIEVHRSRAYPVDLPMYLILSVGAGGPAGLPVADLSNASTFVDYVRVYGNARAFGVEIEPPVEPTPRPTVDTTGFRRVYLPVAARR